jgi:hypothetical protein
VFAASIIGLITLMMEEASTLKCQQTSSGIHGATIQKKAIFILGAVSL